MTATAATRVRVYGAAGGARLVPLRPATSRAVFIGRNPSPRSRLAPRGGPLPLGEGRAQRETSKAAACCPRARQGLRRPRTLPPPGGGGRAGGAGGGDSGSGWRGGCDVRVLSGRAVTPPRIAGAIRPSPSRGGWGPMRTRSSDKGQGFLLVLDNSPFTCFFVTSRPARGASGGVWLQGGIGERGFGWRQLDPSEAVVLRSEGRNA
jgi:hypothetical protein